jgi:hypothetical protein
MLSTHSAEQNRKEETPSDQRQIHNWMEVKDRFQAVPSWVDQRKYVISQIGPRVCGDFR